MLALAPRKNLKNDTGKVFSQSELNIKYLIIYSPKFGEVGDDVDLHDQFFLQHYTDHAYDLYR